MKKKWTKALKFILLTVTSLAVGYAAIAFPFKLFENLTADGMRTLFYGELALYFTVSMGFLFFKGKREERKAKEAARTFQKRIKFEQAQRDYYDLAA